MHGVAHGRSRQFAVFMLIVVRRYPVLNLDCRRRSVTTSANAFSALTRMLPLQGRRLADDFPLERSVLLVIANDLAIECNDPNSLTFPFQQDQRAM